MSKKKALLIVAIVVGILVVFSSTPSDEETALFGESVSGLLDLLTNPITIVTVIAIVIGVYFIRRLKT